MLRSNAFALVLLCATHASPLFAWGNKGHQLVTAVAIERSPAPLKRFFTPNTTRLRTLAVVPDTRWKQTATYPQEKFHHFYQIDEYANSPLANILPAPFADALQQSTAAFLKTNGTAVWRAEQIFQMLVEAFRTNQPEKILQWAGVVSHYVGDLSQPMHTTSDYDGQSIQRRGIHKYFEVDVLERIDEPTLFQDILRASATTQLSNDLLVAQNSPVYNLSIGSPSWAVVRTHQLAQRSLADLPAVIHAFSGTQDPTDQTLLNFSVPEMALGARTLAEVWEKAWITAGSPTGLPSRAITVADPAFVPFTQMTE